MTYCKYLISKFSALLLVVAALSSCGDVDTIKITTTNLNAFATGPLFEGVNTASADFKFEDFLPENIKKENIQTVKIQAISITPVVAESPKPSGYTLLLASPKTSMQAFGFYKNGDTAVSLTNDQTFISDIMKDEKHTLVIDFNIAEDYYDNYTFGTKIDWLLTVKK